MLFILSVSISVLIGIVVLIQDPTSLARRYLLGLVVFASLWMTGIETSVSVDLMPLLVVRMVFVFAVLMTYCMYMFINSLYAPNNKTIIQLLGTTVAIAASLSPYVVASVHQTMSDGQITGIEIERQFMYIPVLAWLIYLAAMGIYELWKKYDGSRGLDKKQSGSILWVFSITALIALTTNALIPAATGSTFSTTLAPVSLVFLSFGLSYAIIRHKFMSIRLIITRSVAYVLLLTTMAALYAVLIFGISALFFDSENIDLTQQAVFIVAALFIATTFQPLKRFFDKLTDKIFYRQLYDSEKILTEYSDFLVDEVETEEIINYTVAMINNALNPESVYIVLYRGGVGEWYDSTGMILENTRAALARALEYQKTSILNSDLTSIREDEFTKNIKDHLGREGLKLSVKLSTHGQLEGFALLGDKKNGSRYSPDDYKFLATIANELSVSLQNSARFDEIQKFNRTLKEQVEAATKKLRESNKKLQTLDQAKDEFISMASHQLRTPLTSVKGYVSMILEGDAGPVTDDQKKLLGEAFSSSQRMVYLISDLLNVSRLKTGKFIIEPSPVFLPKMVEEEVNQLIPAAQTRNLVLRYAPPTRFPELTLDETKTRQVIMNFIDNAIYYTKSGGQIEITLQAMKDHVEYRVKDTGIGVPTRDQHKLFTKFFRARNARSARPDGTGLGLYMAQKIITAQGGTIYFESKEGKGSVFGFNLPLSDKTSAGKSDK